MKKKDQKQLNQKSQPQKAPPRSPNLLRVNTPKPKISKYNAQLVNLLKILILITEITLVTLLGINIQLKKDISTLNKNISGIVLQVESKKVLEEQINEVIAKTQLHENLLANKQPMASNIERLISLTSPKVKILRADISPWEIGVGIETPSPLNISLQISSYLNSGLAKEVTIESAYLNTANNNFQSELELKIK